MVNATLLQKSSTRLYSARPMNTGRDDRYHIVETKQYRRDLRRLLRAGRYDVTKLDEVVNLLACGEVLPARHRNHWLHGELVGCEECRITSDWLLIYQRRDQTLTLMLVRTGRHTDLFEE